METDRQRLDVDRIGRCDEIGKRRKRNVRSRIAVTVAASVLTLLMLLVKRVLRRESIAATESFVPRWVDAEDREAA
jgi:hypothetical protein